MMGCDVYLVGGLWMDGWMSTKLRCVCCRREGPQVWRYMYTMCGGSRRIANRTTFQKSRGQDRL